MTVMEKHESVGTVYYNPKLVSCPTCNAPKATTEHAHTSTTQATNRNQNAYSCANAGSASKPEHSLN